MIEQYNKINKNLYQILEIDKNATSTVIKQAYKRLALKYHPDKNPSKDANETFNHIKIAYDILSNEDSKKKYDSLNEIQHNNLLDVIYNFVKSLIEPETMEKLIQKIFNNDTNILEIFKPTQNNIPNYDLLKEQIDKRLQDHLDLEHITEYVAKLNAEHNDKQEELSFYRPNEYDENKFITNNKIAILPEKNYKLISTVTNNTETTTNTDTSYLKQSTVQSQGTNIHCEIKTNLDEIYNNTKKKIIVKRQIIENNDIIYKQFEYEVELNNDQVIFEGHGDNYVDSNNIIKSGNLIVNIICKQHQYFKRVNEYDILINLPLTIYELFNGFNKTFDFFANQKIKIIMQTPFGQITSDKHIIKQQPFDGHKSVVVLSDLGLPNTINNKIGINRGNLIIFLVLIKKEGFNEKLKNI